MRRNETRHQCGSPHGPHGSQGRLDIHDYAFREVCSSETGGRFSKATVQLYGFVGMHPGHRLVTELNATHMDYTDLNSLALHGNTGAAARVGDAVRIGRGPAQGVCVSDQDIARALRQMCDCALADFSNNPHDGAAIYQHMSQEVTN